jgi:hypothetical protein
MIQFNLLPEIKLKYLKAQKLRRFITIGAVGLSAIAIAIFIFMLFFVDVIQKKSISDLNHDITRETAQINATKNIDTILTVQNQLNSLPALYSQRPVVLRLFDYLNQMTPQNISATTLGADFGLHTITLTGKSNNLQTVNNFIDTIKLTTYNLDTSAVVSADAPFNSVVLSSFSIDSTNGASFTITFSFNPIIFDESHTIKLNLPTPTSNLTNVSPTAFFKNLNVISKGIR